MEVLVSDTVTLSFKDGREPTAIDFFPRYGTLLTVNIGEVKWREERFLDLSFLQPVDTSNAIIRPIGGTPKPLLVALTSRHLSLEFAPDAPVIRLRIIAPLIPLVRHLGPPGTACESRVLIGQ